MKKIFVKALLVSLSLLTFSIPNNLVYANTTDTSNDNKSALITEHEKQELFKKFPDFEESLKENTTGSLAGRENVYIKYTPKTDNTKKVNTDTDDLSKNYDITTHTKEEYIQEMFREQLNNDRGISPPDVVPTSWLNLDLQVYYGDDSDYMAYNFCSWLKTPLARFDDGIAIGVSSQLGIGRNKTEPLVASYSYYAPLTPDGVKTITKDVVPNPQGTGTMATFKLDRNPHLNDEFHNLMIQAPVEYTNTSAKSGRISGQYLHKQLGIGSIGIDATGMLNLSVSATHDKHISSVHVSR